MDHKVEMPYFIFILLYPCYEIYNHTYGTINGSDLKIVKDGLTFKCADWWILAAIN